MLKKGYLELIVEKYVVIKNLLRRFLITTINPQFKPKPRKKSGVRPWAVIFLLCLWQLVSMLLDQEVILVSPLSVVRRLTVLLIDPASWKTVVFSSLRITLGFVSAVLFGTVMAGLAARFQRVEELLAPIVLMIKSIPVASYIILVLIWTSSRNLSVSISFLIVFPVIYLSVLEGIRNTDKRLLEMARVFQLSDYRKIRYIYMPQILPFFLAASKTASGLSWKSGTAAEVIGVPAGSIGERLYNAKAYLNTPDLFAWTIIVVLISILLESCFLWIVNQIAHRLELSS